VIYNRVTRRITVLYQADLDLVSTCGSMPFSLVAANIGTEYTIRAMQCKSQGGVVSYERMIYVRVFTVSRISKVLHKEHCERLIMPRLA
jgi:hypothetical protein